MSRAYLGATTAKGRFVRIAAVGHALVDVRFEPKADGLGAVEKFWALKLRIKACENLPLCLPRTSARDGVLRFDKDVVGDLFLAKNLPNT